MAKTVCYRCGSALGAQGGLLLAEVCDSCLKVLLSSSHEELSALLESIQQPAALVRRDLAVVFSNSRLGRMFKKFDHDIVGLGIGTALDCAFATSDTRCGEGAYCLHCGIRRLVELSRITGEKISHIPMTFRHKSGLDQSYIFTTEKTGDAVLLTIGT